MGRIKNDNLYIIDSPASKFDKVIGSDAENSGRTKNYLLGELFALFNTLGGGGVFSYTYTSDLSDLDILDGLVATNDSQTDPNGVNLLRFSRTDLFGKDLRALAENYNNNSDGVVLKITSEADPNLICAYTITGINVDTNWVEISVLRHKNLNTLTFEVAKNFTLTFDLVNLDGFGGGGGATNTSQLVNDGEDGINPFISLQDLITDHTALSNIGVNTHAQIDSHIADSTIHFTQASISITESQISDLQDYFKIDQTTPQTIINGVPIFSEGINTTSIQFDTGATPLPSSPGLLQWNLDEETLDLNSGGVTYQLGQEIAPLVKNQTGTTITNGTPVMFGGTLGASGRVLVIPAYGDGTLPSSYILGLTTEDIADGDDGHVTWFGKVRQIDTTGAPYGEVWNEGDLLYVSPTTAGDLTNVPPQAPNPQIFMAVVVSAHATQGTLFTRPSWRGKLTDLDDVNGTPLTTSGQLVVWDETSKIFDFTSNISDFSLSGHTHTESEITDLQAYLLNINSESIGDLSDVTVSAPVARHVLVNNGGGVWVNRALLEADISDLQSYSIVGHTHLIADITDFTDNSTNWDTAFGWGDHSGAGYELQSNKGTASGYAPLGSDSKIPNIYIPALAISDTYVVASQAAMLLLTLAETGDVAVRTDENKTYILQGTDYSVLGDWQELLTPTDAVQSVNGLTGTVTLDLSFTGSTGILGITGGNTVDLGFTTTDTANWNTAFGWGDHSLAGYIDGSGVADQIATFSGAGTLTSSANFSLSPTLFTLDVGGAGNGAISMSLAGATTFNSATSLELRTDAFTWKDAAGGAVFLDSAGGNVRIHGQAVLRDYGNGTYTGTEAKLLAVQTNGNIIEKNLTDYLTPTGDGSGLTNINADTLDNLDSTQFLRSDVDDVASGNIGIGITPTVALHVSKSVSSNFLSILEAKTGDVSSNNLALAISSSATNGYVIRTRQTADGTWSGTSPVELFNVRSNGNVSIGNTNNTYKLDVTGSGRFTGDLIVGTTTLFSNSNVTIGGYATHALAPTTGNHLTNKTYVDGQVSGAISDWLRADVADIKTSGDLTFNDNVAINLGTGNDTDLYFDSSNTYMRLSAGNFYIQDLGVATRFTFTRTTGDFTATGVVASNGGDSDDWNTAFGWGDWSTGVDKAFVDALNVDADTLDGLNSVAFLRANADDTLFANLNVNDTNTISLGFGSDLRMHHTTNVNYFDLYNGDLLIRDNNTTRFTFGRTTGDFTAAGDITTDKGGYLQASNNYDWTAANTIGVRMGNGVSTPEAGEIDLRRWKGSGTLHDVALITQTLSNGGWGLNFLTDSSATNTKATTTRMYISPTGNVGIGTTAPSETLHISNGNATTFSEQGTIAFCGNDLTRYSAISGYRQGSSQQAGLLFRTLSSSSNVDAMLLSNVGDLGIGTLSPQVAIDLERTKNNAIIRTTSSTDDALWVDGDIYGSFEMYSQDGSNGGAGLVGYLRAVNSTTATGNRSDLVFGNRDAANLISEKMRLDYLGNVGIGNSSPQAKLHITNYVDNGNVAMFKGKSTNDTNSTTISITNGFSTEYTKEIKIGAVAESANSNVTGMALYTSPNSAGSLERVRIDGNGNVGIGTTAPSDNLVVQDATNARLKIISYTSAAEAQLTFATIGGDTTFEKSAIIVSGAGSWGRHNMHFCVNNEASSSNVTLADSRMMIDYATGNVGIGTSTPKRNVDIAASNPILRLTSTKDGTWTVGEELAALEFYGSDISGAGAAVQGKINLVARATFGDDFDMAFHVDDAAGTLVERMRILATGNVAIGKTTASTALDVAGAGTFSSTVTATNFILSSDKRLKTNIKPISADDYVDVSWKTFRFKNNKQNRYGVVAQELEKKHPEFVRTDDEGMKSVAYIDLLIAKIAELEARLEKAGI